MLESAFVVYSLSTAEKGFMERLVIKQLKTSEKVKISRLSFTILSVYHAKLIHIKVVSISLSSVFPNTLSKMWGLKFTVDT